MGVAISTIIGMPVLAGIGGWSSYVAAKADMSVCKETKWLEIGIAIMSFAMIPIVWAISAAIPTAGSVISSFLIVATLFAAGVMGSVAAHENGSCTVHGQASWLATTAFVSMAVLIGIVVFLG